MKNHSIALLASFTLSAALLGCSKKGPECEQCVSTLNPGVEALNKAMALPEEKPDQAIVQAQAVAKAADDATTSFGKLNLTTPELQKFVTDYKALLGEVSTSAKGQEAAAKAYVDLFKKLEALPNEMKGAMDKLVKACSEEGMKPDEQKECTAVLEHIKNAPTDFDDVEKLKKYSADLKKTEAKRQHTKDGLKELATAYDGFAKIGADSKAAETKLKAAEAGESAALKKQNASVDTLNKFCAI